MSLAWQFFKNREDEPIIAVCQLCQQEVLRAKLGSARKLWSSRHLLKHLLKHHGPQYEAAKQEQQQQQGVAAAAQLH